MKKTILITGSTDGIGLEAAKTLAGMGHEVLLHGRNPAKLEDARQSVLAGVRDARLASYLADLSRFEQVEALAEEITDRHSRLDVLINNAGIFKTPDPITADGLDIRFVVNTLAPYLLTRKLMPLLGEQSRVINLSSAAQSPVDPQALVGEIHLSDDFAAYAQSKLAITMWSRRLAQSLGDGGPMIVAVNPGSLLATKMVKEGFGMAGNDIRIGADILVRAALDDEFANTSGLYFDNDSGQFAPPHRDALDERKSSEIVNAIETVLTRFEKGDRGGKNSP
jgi:NAD(P)-dependent dehydrogenase (short-subunit alcohol dehydrogenase family)